MTPCKHFHARLEHARQIHEVLVDKLQSATEAELSAEERAARMDEILNEEQRTQKTLTTELKALREVKFKKTGEVQEARREEKSVQALIEVSSSQISAKNLLFLIASYDVFLLQGGRGALRNLDSKVRKLDGDGLKQQEILYNQVEFLLTFVNVMTQ